MDTPVHKALNLVQSSYNKLWADLAIHKLPLDQILDKHKPVVLATNEEVESLVEVIVPEVLIVLSGGEVQEVHSQYEDITYAVLDLEENIPDFTVFAANTAFAEDEYEKLVENVLEQEDQRLKAE